MNKISKKQLSLKFELNFLHLLVRGWLCMLMSFCLFVCLWETINTAVLWLFFFSSFEVIKL